MKKIIFLVLLFTPFLMPQSKYFIYFKDKGAKTSLNKASVEYNAALNNFSEKAVERRKAVLGEDNIITYEDLPVCRDYTDSLENMGIKIIRRLSWLNSVSVNLTDEQFKETTKLPFVDKIEKVKTIKFNRNEEPGNDILNKAAISADTSSYGVSYTQLKMSGIPEVHAAGITGSGVLVGFLDSGFDWKRHESLKNAKVEGEYDFVFNDSVTANQTADAKKQDEHGTKVFSVVGGFKPGSFEGAAFDASFLLAKTENVATETKVEEDNYAAALIWMEQKGVDITSSSLGYTEFDDESDSYTYRDMDGKTAISTIALEHAFKLGVITVTAAGNEGENKWYYISAPGDGKNAITVGAVNSSDQLAKFSSRGPTYDGRIKPEVTALGVSVYGAVSGTTAGYSPSNGTSLATPIVCGVVTLLKSAYPYLLNTQVRKILMETSDNASSPNNDIGYGLVSAAKAVSYPNIEKSGDSFLINKMFIPGSSKGIFSVEAHISADGNSYTTASLSPDSYSRYVLPLSGYTIGDTLDLYYTYTDNSGTKNREPASDNYKLVYGGLNVYHSLAVERLFPFKSELYNNYPNPFRYSTTLSYGISKAANVKLTIYNILGERINTLVNSYQIPGNYEVRWSAGNCASGIYIYVLEAGGDVLAGKMLIVR
jgi:hypothetical protein